MGHVVPFPPLRVPNAPTVADAIAGDIPLWRVTAEVFGPTGPRQIAAILVQPAPGHLDLLRAQVQGHTVDDLPSDPTRPDRRWGEVAYALLGLWLEAPVAAAPGVRLVPACGTVGDLAVEAVLAVRFGRVRSAMWTAHESGRDGVVVHGRVGALAP